MTVYADVLMLVNFVVDYFLLLISSHFLQKKPRLYRMILSSAIGGVFSLYIFLPKTNFLINCSAQILACALMCLTAFGFGKIKSFFRGVAVLFCVNFAYSGAMIAVWLIFKPYGMVINNSVVYFTAGRTYHLTLYAYVKTPVPEGTTVYLLALDNTQGNRVLAQGLFNKAGVYCLDMDWTLGNTGEYALTLYSSSNSFRNMDIYLGDFTVSVPAPMNPNGFVSRNDYKIPTAEELLAGHTFDFTEGNLLNTGHDAYTTLDLVPTKAAEAMRAAGFGDTVYFAEETYDMNVTKLLQNGKHYTVTLDVYDCIGNLASSGARGAFVLLRMTGGQQNSAEVSYQITVDPNDSRHLTLFFDIASPGLGTDTLRFYELMPCEYYINSVTVQEK